VLPEGIAKVNQVITEKLCQDYSQLIGEVHDALEHVESLEAKIKKAKNKKIGPTE
jgi:cell division septum initiation protein DivIVA